MSQRNFSASTALRTSVLAALLAAGPLAAGARAAAEPAEKPPPVPVAERGPQVGSRIPDFKARDQFGTERDLASLTGRDGLVLLFVRSADW